MGLSFVVVLCLPNPELGIEKLPLSQSTNQQINRSTDHVWHLFVIRHPGRNELQQYLKGKGIQTMIHYPIPPHKQKAYKNWNNLSYPVTEKIHSEVLSIPLNEILTTEEVDNVVKILNQSNI